MSDQPPHLMAPLEVSRTTDGIDACARRMIDNFGDDAAAVADRWAVTARPDYEHVARRIREMQG